MYNGIGAFNWNIFSWSFFPTENKSSQCAWFPSVVKGQKGGVRFMNMKQHF